MKKRLLTILSILILVLPAMSQRRKVDLSSPEQKARQTKLEHMLNNTQRIQFIDSMVVDKQDFLHNYRLAPEVGQIARYQDIFHAMNQPKSYVYVNDLHSRCYLSLESADSSMTLYTCENIDNHWSRPVVLNGVNDGREFTCLNYPFMMSDGQTFYFAAEGNEGIGGYDIYVTRYDTETGKFLHPVNIGMPFNSEANDYMYVIDEFSNLGWFATERNQPADKVCIYIFIPPHSRQAYNTLGLKTEEISSFARIDRISDTWHDRNACDVARQRLHSVSSRKQQMKQENTFQFVISDDITYSQFSDFKAPGNVKRYKDLTTLLHRYWRLLNTLTQARGYYESSDEDERQELRPEILASEKAQHELYLKIHQLEKTIRNNEIIFLTKSK